MRSFEVLMTHTVSAPHDPIDSAEVRPGIINEKGPDAGKSL
jgi:hypothetical protein